MTAFLKNLITLTLMLLATACAPKGKIAGGGGDESWWHVTPVDISQQEAAVWVDMSAVPAYRLVDAEGRRQTSLTKDVLGQVSEGAKYALMIRNYGDRIPLFACANGDDHFTSNDSRCEGATLIRLLGYLNRAPMNETPRAVYRCAGPSVHFDTTDAAECAEAGLVAEMILGYSR